MARALAALIVVSALGSACNPSFRGSEIIAEVNGRKIAVEDYLKVRDQFKLGETTETRDSKLAVRNIVLKYLIRRSVLLNQAEKRGLAVTDQELASFITESKLNEALPPDAKEELLIERKITNDYWKKSLTEDLLIEKLLKETSPRFPKPSLSQMLAAYEKQSSRFQKEASAEALILILPSLEVAEAVRSRLKGPRDLLLEYLKASALDLNLETQTIYQGTLAPELDTALFHLPGGALSKPIKTADGFAIIRVFKIKPSLNLAFDQVKDQIQEELVAEARHRFLENQEESWIREATVRYNRSLIEGL